MTGVGIRGRRERVDEVTMSESDSLESVSGCVSFRWFVSIGVGVSEVALSAAESSSSSKG